ncbi:MULTISPECIES: DUF4294 domain-containing protein [Flavobacterium]|uniref:DUF4294 domain-containing protein n=1 Tax=Flavobacterium jumunjinense TaxID=998845 RepID=A0ABV5GNJ3_9FLAO|nr:MULTISPECIES: DUF4294 domain-containing protein [Flavobacterium]
MKKYTIIIFLLYTFLANCQVQDTLSITAQDSSLLYSIELKEIVVSKEGISAADLERKKLLILKRRVYKTYPYAVLTSQKLKLINETMDKLKTKKEKKKYFKIVEKYLEEEFEPRLKKLSRKDGQILVKLIYRQTGETTFDLIKEYKSGWKAFWSNNTAKLFDINIKEDYQPFNELEDFYIETILAKAFNDGSLERQPAAKPIDIISLANIWREKAAKMRELQDSTKK